MSVWLLGIVGTGLARLSTVTDSRERAHCDIEIPELEDALLGCEPLDDVDNLFVRMLPRDAEQTNGSFAERLDLAAQLGGTAPCLDI